MEKRNMQSFEGTLLPKLLRWVACLLFILVPLSISMFCGGNEGICSSQMATYLRHCFEGNRFWMSSTNDFTSHSMALIEDGGAVFIQGVFCVLAESVLLRVAIRTKKKHFYPFTLVYSVYSLFVILATIGDYLLNWGFPSRYNRFMLWGHYVRAMYGYLPVIIYIAFIFAFLYYVIKDYLILRNHSNRTSNE